MNKKNTSKVSVIIPVYNTNKEYFRICINSVLNQTYENIEVIIVDDGSTTDICYCFDEYEKVDNRVRVIRQENRGVGYARNMGIKEATGDYVMFVDADDIISKHMIRSAVECALEDDADLVIGMTNNIWSHSDFKCITYRTSDTISLTSNESQERLIKTLFLNSSDEEFVKKSEIGFIGRGPDAKLVKKEIAKSTKFPVELVCGEDFIWNLRIINKCNNIYIKKEVWYGYLQYYSTVRGYKNNREEISRKYLETLKSENEDFIKKYPYAYYSCIATEFYILLRYNLLSDKCKLSTKEKKHYVRNLLVKEPWQNIVVKGNRKILPFSTKLFLFTCDIGMWHFFLKLWIYKEKCIDRRFG